jgi:hypothetical protein
MNSMKLIEATNEVKLTEKKLEAHLEFLRRYGSRPSIREDSFQGQEAQKVKERIQACEDLIKRHEWLRRAITYTNLVSSIKVMDKTYSLHALIQHKSKLAGSFGGSNQRGICDLKRKLYSALDDRATYQEIDKIRSQQPKDSSLTIKVVHNYDIEEVGKKKIEIDELEMAIDSALQMANAKLDLLSPPETFTQQA